jgi:hypothetical protein
VILIRSLSGRYFPDVQGFLGHGIIPIEKAVELWEPVPKAGTTTVEPLGGGI